MFFDRLATPVVALAFLQMCNILKLLHYISDFFAKLSCS